MARKSLASALWLITAYFALLSLHMCKCDKGFQFIEVMTAETDLKFQSHKYGDGCIFTIVESLPEGLEFPNATKGTPALLSIYDAHLRLMQRAKTSLHLGTFYWTLQGKDLPYYDNTSDQGEDVFKHLKEITQSGKVDVKIAQNAVNMDTPVLASLGAQVRTLDFNRLLGGGVLHTKMWIADDEHFYIGSANFDWRSYTQIKELGVLVENCPQLGADVAKIFEVYWQLGKVNSSIPPKWPDSLSTEINMTNPAMVHFNQTSAPVYMSSSPPPFCPNGRTTDVDAVLNVIRSAEKFIYISVMDYFPAFIYTKHYRYWAVIDDELRRAVVDRKVTLHLMTGHWAHTDPKMYAYLGSMSKLSGLHRGEVKVNLFTVPATKSQQQIPFARVNHCKYMVTDQHAYIGTSNWSADYFVVTAGVGFVVYQPKGSTSTPNGNLRQQLEDIFVRDFTSAYSRPLY